MASEQQSFQLTKEGIRTLIVLFFLTTFIGYSTLFLSITFKTILLLGFFIILGAISRLPQRLAPVSFGIELVSLVTIISAIVYGSWIGLFIGAVSILLSGYYTIERPQDVFIATIGFMLMGYFTPIMYSLTSSLGLTAILLTIGYDLITNVFYFFTGHSLMGCIRFSAMHIPSNYVILIYLGPILLAL